MCEIKELAISKLKKYGCLKRRHSRVQMEKCIHSIERYGQYAPIVVSENEVICGQLVFDALKKLKKKKVFAVDLGILSDEQKKEIRFVDNQTFDSGDWNIENLKDSLMKIGFDSLEDIGFDYDEANNLINDIEVDEIQIKDVEVEYECVTCGWVGTKSEINKLEVNEI